VGEHALLRKRAVAQNPPLADLRLVHGRLTSAMHSFVGVCVRCAPLSAPAWRCRSAPRGGRRRNNAEHKRCTVQRNTVGAGTVFLSRSPQRTVVPS
jgi:hypothetical protein